MPQIFQVLRCYKCSVFQVHQTKKSNKLICKLCGEKQSIKRHYGIGTAKDCRLHVQKLNGIRKDLDDLSDNISEEEIQPPIETQTEEPKNSKWSSFVDENKQPETTEETMFLDNEEVVLEIPKKKARKHVINKQISNSVAVSTDQSYSNSCDFKYANHQINTVRDIEKHIDLLSQSSNIKLTTKLNKEDSIPHFDTENRVIQDFAPNCSQIRKSSKWAQYIDEEEIIKSGSESSIDNCSQDKINDTVSNSQDFHNSKTFFSLCKDDDLDSILDI